MTDFQPRVRRAARSIPSNAESALVTAWRLIMAKSAIHTLHHSAGALFRGSRARWRWSLGEPVRRFVRPHHHSANAAHARSSDRPESRCAAGRIAARKPARLCRHGSLSARGNGWLARVQSHRPRRSRTTIRRRPADSCSVYPFVAFLAGYMFERGTKSFARAAIAGLLADFCCSPEA